MQVYLQALGCRLNEAELQRWGADFVATGHIITNQVTKADLVVINTCAVTHNAVRESRRLIKRAQRQNPHAKLVVSGCYSSLNPTLTDELGGIDLIVSNDDKEALVKKTLTSLKLPTQPVDVKATDNTHLFARGRHRAFIKVQDGCRHHCTYCIVTIARGKERSRTIADIVDDVNRLCIQGVQEVVLSGVHLGGYGSDIESDLCLLVDAILRDSDIPRIRLSSLEPWNIADNFGELFANPRLMPHLHLPLQSGSDSVLKRMARRTKTLDFEALVTTLRNAIPDLNITTDIIVGFPGETVREWQESLEFIERMQFSHIHIFSYSARPGTHAAQLPEQLSPTTKKKRSRMLHQLAATMKTHCLKQHINQNFQILWEHGTTIKQGVTRYHGYTPNFLRTQIDLPYDQHERSLVNTIRPAQVVNASDEVLRCALA